MAAYMKAIIDSQIANLGLLLPQSPALIEHRSIFGTHLFSDLLLWISGICTCVTKEQQVYSDSRFMETKKQKLSICVSRFRGPSIEVGTLILI